MKKFLIIAAMAFTLPGFALLTGCGKNEKPVVINSHVEPDTIKYYRAIIDTAHAPGMQKNARFMICYLYFNKFKDTANARKNMNEFLKLYPENDSQGTRESVQIMLDVMNGKK